MTEIGGYLELERYEGKSLHPGAIELDCGRNCLAYLIELRGFRSLWIPDWLCHSVRDVCVREGIEVHAYCINSDMLPVYDFEMNDGEWLYLVDYYGQLRSEDVREAYLFSGGRVVVDEAHGLYRPAWNGADTLWTCRKWFGVPDGAYLSTGDGTILPRSLPRAMSADRMRHILGRAEGASSDYLFSHRVSDASFADEPVSEMSVIAHRLLSAVDSDGVASKRRDNWRALEAGLAKVNRLTLHMPDVPFMYPLLLNDASGFRESLAEEGVFVPMLWPDVLSEPGAGAVARDYVMNILPLPIDQRYGEREMEFVVEKVKQCLQ